MKNGQHIGSRKIRAKYGAAVLMAAAVFASGGAVSPSVASTETGAPATAPLSSEAVSAIRKELASDIAAVKANAGAERDQALVAVVARVMVEAYHSYGAGTAGQIASVILASAGISPEDVGTGLGRAAVEIAANDVNAGNATAQAVANEGLSTAVGGCAQGAEKAGSHRIAQICEGEPVVTGAAGLPGVSGNGAGLSALNSGVVPPAPPPPPCANPSCS